MKKVISIYAALTLLCAAFPAGISAASTVKAGSCGETASWTLESGTLKINGTGDMSDSKPEWYDYSKEISKVVIADGITHIGASAFGGFESLKGTVTVPQSVKSIGGYAFAGCDKLEKIEMSDAIEEIGAAAFAKCSKLAEINIPDTVKSIGANAFYETEWLLENKNDFVILGDGILYKYKGSDEQVIVPDDVKIINSYAFAENKTIKSVNTSKAIKIGSAAFINCELLEGIQLGDSLEAIGDAAFKNCTAVKEMIVPQNVTEIGVGAFSGCTELTDLKLPENTKSINTELLYNNSKLEKFDTPQNVTSIGELSFANTALTEINIPENVEKISAGAFSGCEKAKYVKLPKSIKEIGENAFIGCTDIEDIYYDGTAQDWEKISIADGNSVLGRARIHYADDIKITVNGRYISFDVNPFIENDCTLVPVRAIFDALGAKVSWEEELLAVVAVKGEDVISVEIGSNVMYKSGDEIPLEVSACIVNDRTFIPARAVAEALNCKVDWNGETRTVIITE